MPAIAVVNRKGGSGKSTLSTNIAAWCAHQGWQVMLGDSDHQQSMRTWLQRRSPALPHITSWMVDNSKMFRAPRGTTHVVLDTPGALYGYELAKLLVQVKAIVVPVGPSLFDREASRPFIRELLNHPRVSSGKCRMAVVGMRWPTGALDGWRRGSEEVWGQSLLTVIPDDPRYSALLDSGASIFDDRPAPTPQDWEHWAPLMQWLSKFWCDVQAQAAAPVTRACHPQMDTVN